MAVTSRPSAAADNSAPRVRNVVLVHGAWADGSSWAKVIPLLEKAGLNAVAVQNPLTSLADDVAATKRAIARLDGPVILVGHSYGGAVAPGWPGHSCRPFVRRCRDQRRRQRPESRRPRLCSGVRSGCGRGGRRPRQGISAGSRRRRAAAGRGRVPDDDDEGCPGKLCPGSSDGGEKASRRHAGPDKRRGLRRETDECGVEDKADLVRGRRQ